MEGSHWLYTQEGRGQRISHLETAGHREQVRGARRGDSDCPKERAGRQGKRRRRGGGGGGGGGGALTDRCATRGGRVGVPLPSVAAGREKSAGIPQRKALSYSHEDSGNTRQRHCRTRASGG